MDDIYFLLMRLNARAMRPEIKKQYRASFKHRRDPLAVSLRDHKWKEFWSGDPWRRVYRKNDWESWYEFVIMPDWEDEPDESVQKAVNELEIHICSPYDCTGKPFSSWIHWKRTKAGVAIIRRMALDV